MLETHAAEASRQLGAGPADVRPAAIIGLATELPAGRLTNAELAATLGITEEWIVSRTGIRERRRAEPDERLSDYAARVGAAALARAGVPAAELDLVIVATMTQDELTPNTAPIVAHAIGAHRAGAFDIGAACTAFLVGLSQGTAQIESGRAEHVLRHRRRLHHPHHRLRGPPHGAAVRRCRRRRGARGGRRRIRAGLIGPIVLGADGSHAQTITAIGRASASCTWTGRRYSATRSPA